ncbi:hypothetical protein [Roseovarius sp. MMSF_3281]|uniref:hypothetical protein n=1 Tax=Roseovarius sp. MMSF_3281 TaxID=3046694 RepID=UPI00273DED77|nr:hypothetical protein [Roseovarius sp. MMSF_3281]
MTTSRTPFADLPRATQAGIMCNDPRFRAFAATRAGAPAAFTTSAAAEWLRSFCNVTSRRDLDTNPQAARRFDTLKTEFDAHTGKIPRPER